MTLGNWRRIEAPPFSDQRIVQAAEELTKEYIRVTNPDPALVTINFDHIYDNFIYPKYEIVLEEDCDLGYDEQGKKILGRFDVETNTACIDVTLGGRSRDPRRTFTCWHEVGGHGILQGPWLRREMSLFHDFRYLITTEDFLDDRTQHVLERQANLFAAHAAAPTWFLRQVIHRTYRSMRAIRYIGPGKYCLSVNGFTVYRDIESFDHLCRTVAYYIKSRFGGLSVEALGYRIAQVGFVIDAGHPGFRLNRVTRAIGPSSDRSQFLAAAGAQ